MKWLQPLKKLKGVIGVITLLLVVFVYAMFQGGFVSWFLFFLVIPLSIYSLLLSVYPISKIEVERTIETRQLHSGGKFSATIHVKRKSRFPLMYTSFEEKVSESLKQSTSCKQLTFWGMKKEYKWTYEMEHLPRGEHELEGSIISVSDLFGWVQREVFIPNKERLLVFPNLIEMVYIPIKSKYDQGTVASRIQIMKDTSMAIGVRSYQPGDRVSLIHWKSFARTQTLKTKEFEDRQSQDMFVLIDRNPSLLFEGIVDLTASIMQAIVRRHASSAFLSIGESRFYIPVVQNVEQLYRVLYHLTKVQPDLSKPVEQVLLNESTISQATSLLYITSNLTYEWIDSIRMTAKNLRVCTCFVMKEKQQKLTKVENSLQQYAASRGIDVYVMTKDRFAQAFLEVNRP